MNVPPVRRRYHGRTLEALLRHLAIPERSTKTYLATHPRVTQEQIDAIVEDLQAAVDRKTAEASGESSGAEERSNRRRRRGDVRRPRRSLGVCPFSPAAGEIRALGVDNAGCRQRSPRTAQGTRRPVEEPVTTSTQPPQRVSQPQEASSSADRARLVRSRRLGRLLAEAFGDPADA